MFSLYFKVAIMVQNYVKMHNFFVKKKKRKIFFTAQSTVPSSFQHPCSKLLPPALFEDDNTDIYTSSVLFYIKCHMDNVNTTKRIHKPEEGRRRIEDHFGNWDPCWAWQGIRHTISLTSSSTLVAEQLNYFFGCFEETRPPMTIDPAPATNSQALVIQFVDVICTLCKINTQKGAGPDGVPGRILRDCAVELGEVFTNIFNFSLSQCTVPTHDISQRLQACGTNTSNHKVPGETG